MLRKTKFKPKMRNDNWGARVMWSLCDLTQQKVLELGSSWSFAMTNPHHMVNECPDVSVLQQLFLI